MVNIAIIFAFLIPAKPTNEPFCDRIGVFLIKRNWKKLVSNLFYKTFTFLSPFYCQYENVKSRSQLRKCWNSELGIRGSSCKAHFPTPNSHMRCFFTRLFAPYFRTDLYVFFCKQMILSESIHGHGLIFWL